MSNKKYFLCCVKADSDDLRLTSTAAADSCVSAEIGNFPHCTLLLQQHASNAARLNESLYAVV